MAKKARRKKQTVLTQAQLQGTKKQDVVTANKVVIKTHTPEPTEKVSVNFREEYQYVITDLQRIGVLAAVMLVVLISLNLLLN